MRHRRLKTGYFVVEGLNSFATVHYFYYFYFFMQQRFGFGDKANLCLAALNGLIYTVFSVYGGRFAQRFGYFTSLKLGFTIMIGAFATGSQLHSAPGQVLVMATGVIGMCFTWPTLEALVSEGETPAGLQYMVGAYNVVWATTAAVSYFIGGALLERFGLRTLFFLPMSIQCCQLALTVWLGSQARRTAGEDNEPSSNEGGLSLTPPLNPRPIAKAKMFLRMAWLANPFAYIAINTLIAVMPGVAKRLELSTMAAGFCCSVWSFARLGAFVTLWRWSGWHYRFGWLLAAYLALVSMFAGILVSPNVALMALAQIAFGIAAGLIYYSSLFYSMDLSETKGEHGGIHEAAIGLGNFAGPAVGAASLHFLPQYANSGALAVTGLLVCGLGGLLAIRRFRG
jgi:predicted MFS family arabinose efflux permease